MKIARIPRSLSAASAAVRGLTGLHLASCGFLAAQDTFGQPEARSVVASGRRNSRLCGGHSVSKVRGGRPSDPARGQSRPPDHWYGRPSVPRLLTDCVTRLLPGVRDPTAAEYAASSSVPDQVTHQPEMWFHLMAMPTHGGDARCRSVLRQSRLPVGCSVLTLKVNIYLVW